MVCQIPKSLNFCLSNPIRTGHPAKNSVAAAKSAAKQHAQIRLPLDGRILQANLVAKCF